MAMETCAMAQAEPMVLESSGSIGIVDYGMGNLRSVQKAFEFLGASTTWVRDQEDWSEHWDALVLPGVGALRDCVNSLKQGGLAERVVGWIRENRPFFGICLGLQALFDFSEEEAAEGLGVFSGKVVRFRSRPGLRIPHMGWNRVRFEHCHPALNRGLALEGESFYFVHSYHVVPEDPALSWATAHHGLDFTAAIQVGNCFATQFHPEKSQSKGLKIYRNFLNHISGGSSSS